MDPRVSIIMPACDAAAFVGESIDSVVKQTFAAWELIVVDDVSHDETVEIVQQHALQDGRIKVIRRLQRGGPAKARNDGIRLATGRYIAFLDSDDVWLPSKLERQVEVMETTDAVLSYTGYRKMSREGVLWPTSVYVPPTVSYFDLLKSNWIGCLTAMYDTQVLGKMFMPEDTRREDLRLWLEIAKLIHHHEDYALWLSILKRIAGLRVSDVKRRVVGIDEVLALHRMHGGSVSSNKFRAAAYQWAVYRKVEKLSFTASLYYFCHYAYYGYRRNKMR